MLDLHEYHLSVLSTLYSSLTHCFLFVRGGVWYTSDKNFVYNTTAVRVIVDYWWLMKSQIGS